MNLGNERWREFPIWAKFFSSSLIVSMIALFRIKILLYIDLKSPFIFFLTGNQLYIDNEEFVEQIFADIPFISYDFSVYEFNKGFHFQLFAVINNTKSNHAVEILSFVIAYQMQFEAVEPSQQAFASLRYPLEFFVHMYALVAAYAQRGAVYNADARTSVQQALLTKVTSCKDTDFSNSVNLLYDTIRRNRLISDVSSFEVYVFVGS